jgi:hypothetical protein
MTAAGAVNKLFLVVHPLILKGRRKIDLLAGPLFEEHKAVLVELFQEFPQVDTHGAHTDAGAAVYAAAHHVVHPHELEDLRVRGVLADAHPLGHALLGETDLAVARQVCRQAAQRMHLAISFLK